MTKLKSEYDDLIEENFHRGYNTKESVASIGLLQGVWRSERTVQRSLKKQALNWKGQESPIDLIISLVNKELHDRSRNHGVDQLWKRLRYDHGVLVKRQTVRNVVKAIQPERHIKMKRGRLHRRKYIVKGPNYIWHIDGNDKLKPVGFCINAAIDGWSRRIMWLEVDKTNKNPSLICTYFLQTVKRHNIVPRIVRMDKGTENVGIADVQSYIRSFHKDDMVHSCVMFGSSNHNQRIERWWGYCRNSLLQSYIDLFKDLELSGIIQLDNDLHTECLKFCFMRVLRAELLSLATVWNKHRVMYSDYR